jgi:hypothetical protein
MSRPWLPDREPSEAAKPSPLGPLLAGARARGVADGFAWLGLAAILIDDRGEALHVSPGAGELMADSLYVEGGRLRARESACDLALAEAIAEALSLGHTGKVRLSGASGEMWAHVAPMPAEEDDPYQLLRAVVLLNRAPPARH